MLSLLKKWRARLDELAEFLQTHSQASLPMDFQKTPPIGFANVPFSLQQSSSVLSVFSVVNNQTSSFHFF
jgi:hypothetical protein